MYRCLKISTRVLATTTMLALMMGAVGCSTANQTADEGENAFKHQNWDAAVYHYLQALAEDPENVEYKGRLEPGRFHEAGH